MQIYRYTVCFKCDDNQKKKQQQNTQQSHQPKAVVNMLYNRGVIPFVLFTLNFHLFLLIWILVAVIENIMLIVQGAYKRH